MEGSEGCQQALKESLTLQYPKPWALETHDFNNILSMYLSTYANSIRKALCPS